MYRRVARQHDDLGVRIYMFLSKRSMRVFHETSESPREAPPSRCEVTGSGADPSALDLELRLAVQREPYSPRLNMDVAQVKAQLRRQVPAAPSCYNFITDIHELDVGALFRIIYRFIARLVLLDAFHEVKHRFLRIGPFVVGLRGTAVAARRGA